MRVSQDYIQKALAGRHQEGRALHRIVEKCATAGCRKTRTPEHADDVGQELWMFLVNKADKLDDRYNIEPYLIETARKIALTYRRKYSYFGTDGIDTRATGVAGLAGQRTAKETETGIDTIAHIDQQHAINELMRRSPELRDAVKKRANKMNSANTAKKQERSTTAMTTQKIVRHARKRRAKKNEDQIELRALRESIGLTQHVMAGRLGLKLPTYQSYEYGRTKGVPQQVMEDAKNLRIDPEYSRIRKAYEGMSMRKIANAWAKRMGLHPNSPAELAHALGINKSSTSRWLNPKEDVTLSADDLIRYENRVSTEEAFYRKAQERHREKR